MNPGDRYGDYDLMHELGRGSMGIVFLATCRETGQQVALKVVPFSSSEASAEHIEAEKRGAELQQKIAKEDPRVVVVNRILFTNQDLNVEMEYVEGRDLFDLIRKGPLRYREAAEMTAELCEMLCNLGNKTPPVVHADLKPRNVRVRPDGHVKVMDFGIAKEMMRSEGTINMFQTVRYASPERLETTVASKESDLWSVGVMLYEMVTGRHPFQAAAGGWQSEELRNRILSSQGPEPLPDTVPGPLGNIVGKALARRPEQRYASPAKMLVDLRRYLSGLPVDTPEVDDGATRRTGAAARAEVDDSATRRTTATIRPQRPPALPVPAPRRPSYFRRMWQRYPKMVAAVIALFAVAIVLRTVSQMHAADDAGQLKRQIEQNEIGPEEAWTRYQSVLREAPSGFLLFGLNGALKKKLTASGEEPIVDYRRETPSSFEGDWQRAAVNLQRAHDIEPGDKVVLGELRICQGHLSRIRSVSGKGRSRTVNRKEVNAAIEDFEEAEKLLPQSPDPYLGLARVYFYELHDPQNGERMIAEARRRGHEEGKREAIERADGLRDRGIHAEQQAGDFEGMPDQEKQFLTGARDNYQAAIQLYSEASDFSSTVSALMKDTLRRKKNVEDRLSELNEMQVSQ
jgi:predicted Ser/Thr protein kinase/tetratricopeptide (TPR) repeat protein